jgi:hypothetical protein
MTAFESLLSIDTRHQQYHFNKKYANVATQKFCEKSHSRSTRKIIILFKNHFVFMTTAHSKKQHDPNSIEIHADFVKELLIPLSTFVEKLQDLEEMFAELSQILSMKQILLYRVNEDGTYDAVSGYGSSLHHSIGNALTKNINLYLAWKLNRTSCIPLPKFGDNIVVPVGIDGLFLAAGDSRHSREIARVENSLFELVACVIANALRSMRLIEQANTDKLTGLLNRNALDKYIFEGRNPFDRPLGEPVAICMLDIDHFKRFNDTYGHHIGDKVLQHVAQVCKNYFADKGKVYRFG